MAVPTVKTLEASPKISTSLIRGFVAASGTYDLTRTGFEFGSTPDELNTIYDLEVQSGVYDFKVPDLSPDTTYYYNAFAFNSLGKGSGVSSSFTTGKLTREVQPVFLVAWDKQLTTTAGSGMRWFRLDESTLDGPDILVNKVYLEDDAIIDVISGWDNYQYSDESRYVISAEGFAEMRGDRNQAILAEADVVLSNSPNAEEPIDAFNRAYGRYTIRENKNKLQNPSFEFVNIPNWTINDYGQGTYSLGNTVLSGLYSLRLYIPSRDAYSVNGAGTSAYNGIYIQEGIHNSKPYYELDSTHQIFYDDSDYPPPGPLQGWTIGEIPSDVAYVGSPLLTPDLVTYTQGGGDLPVPTVSAIAGGVQRGDGYFTIKSDPMSVSSGLWYTASIYGYGPIGSTFNMALVASGTYGTISSGLTVDNQLSNIWQRYELSYQMPTSSETAYINITTSVIHDSDEIYLDCGQFEKGYPSTGYDGGFVGDKVLPKRPVKILANIDDTDTSLFAGVTETLEPNFSNDTVHVYLHDMGAELEAKEVTTSMYRDIKTSDAIKILISEAELSSGTYIIEDGEKTIDFVWLQEGSPWYYMSNVAEAEGGRIFFDNEGVLQFWNHTRASQGGVASGVNFFDFSDIADLNWRIDKDNIRNHIIVKSSPRKVLDHQLIYTHGYAEKIEAGKTLEVWCRITDPDRNNEGLPCMGIKEPVTGISNDSYYQIRPNSDGTGTNRDSYVVVNSFDAFADSAKIVFKNNYASTLYITTLKLYAAPAKVTQDILVEAEDEDSIGIYGRSTLQIENDFLNSVDDCQNLANEKLVALVDPKTSLRLTAVGSPSVRVGDIITVQDARATEISSGTTQDLVVKSIRWSIRDEFIQDIQLEKLTEE